MAAERERRERGEREQAEAVCSLQFQDREGETERVDNVVVVRSLIPIRPNSLPPTIRTTHSVDPRPMLHWFLDCWDRGEKGGNFLLLRLVVASSSSSSLRRCQVPITRQRESERAINISKGGLYTTWCPISGSSSSRMNFCPERQQQQQRR